MGRVIRIRSAAEFPPGLRARLRKAEEPEDRGSSLERRFLRLLAELAPELPAPVREHRFALEPGGALPRPRQWRFDFAWPDVLVAVEVEGAVFTGGRHTRGVGFTADCEKYNAAVVLGWAVLRVTGSMLRRSEVGASLDQLARLLSDRRPALRCAA